MKTAYLDCNVSTMPQIFDISFTFDMLFHCVFSPQVKEWGREEAENVKVFVQLT